MKNLAARKKLLVAQSDLHRRLIGLKHQELIDRWHSVRNFSLGKHWWWIGGAAVVLLTRRGRGLMRWLPTVVALWRSFSR